MLPTISIQYESGSAMKAMYCHFELVSLGRKWGKEVGLTLILPSSGRLMNLTSPKAVIRSTSACMFQIRQL